MWYENSLHKCVFCTNYHFPISTIEEQINFLKGKKKNYK
jgi:hypothetical protein